MSDGTLAGPSDARTRSESMRPTRAPRSERDSPVYGTSVFSVGAPAILLHGVGGGGGFLDEIAAFGLLGLLIAGGCFCRSAAPGIKTRTNHGAAAGGGVRGVDRSLAGKTLAATARGSRGGDSRPAGLAAGRCRRARQPQPGRACAKLRAAGFSRARGPVVFGSHRAGPHRHQNPQHPGGTASTTTM